MATDEGKVPEGGQEPPKEPVEPKGAKAKQKPPKKGGGVPGWAVAIIVIVVIAVIAGIAVGVVMALSGGGEENQAPVISSMTANPPSVATGQLSAITCVASDPDGDTLDYDWEYTGGELQGSVDNMRTWIAPPAEGTFTVTVTVDDGNGGTDEDSVAIVVAAAPTPTPTLPPTPTSTATAAPTATATPPPSQGSIDIQSNPTGAAVYIDGVDTGSITPYVATHISQGPHVVRLVYPHYEWRTESVPVFGGEIAYINWALDFSPTQSVTIQPDAAVGKDAWVWEDNPSNNYETWDYLFASGDAVGDRSRSYLQFDVSSLPATAVFTNVNLGLYYCTESGTAIAGPVGVYRVTQSWDEATITWDAQPLASATPEKTVNVPASATSAFVNWEITDLVRGWLDGHITNYGVVLMDVDEGTFEGWKGFSSSDSMTASEHPRLVIQYYDPAP